MPSGAPGKNGVLDMSFARGRDRSVLAHLYRQAPLLVQPAELFEYDLYSSTLTADRPDGTPLFTEKLVAEPCRHPVRRAGVMGKFHVVATVTLVTPRQHAGKIFEQVVSGADIGAHCLAGASRLPHDAGLVYKVLGMETELVTSKVRAFWDLVRQEVSGAPIPAARLWG
jgi:urease accessory protein